MKEPTVETLASWSATGVRLREVLEAVDALRHRERTAATRTSVLNLVLIARSRVAARRAADAVHLLGARHPARRLLLLIDPEGDGAGADGERRPGIDAEVCLVGARSSGRPVWFEDIELIVRGPAVGHLDSLIEPFTLPELSVVVWFVEDLPDPYDPLLQAADVLMVDARQFGGFDCFSVLESLTRRCPVVDLSWARLRPWRQLLAGLFEGRHFRPFVHGVHKAEVEGKAGPRHLLGGWLGDRLRLPPEAIRLIDAEHAAVRLEAEHGGTVGRFAVERLGDARVVRASVAIDGGITLESTIPLPEATAAWGLPDALSNLYRDPVYEGALRAALAR